MFKIFQRVVSRDRWDVCCRKRPLCASQLSLQPGGPKMLPLCTQCLGDLIITGDPVSRTTDTSTHKLEGMVSTIFQLTTTRLSKLVTEHLWKIFSTCSDIHKFICIWLPHQRQMFLVLENPQVLTTKAFSIFFFFWAATVFEPPVLGETDV